MMGFIKRITKRSATLFFFRRSKTTGYLQTLFLITRLAPLLVMAFLTGCMSMGQTFGQESKSKNSLVYIGVKKWGDFYVDGPPKGTDGFGHAAWYVMAPFGIVDLPLSGVTDTLLLPYTLSQNGKVNNLKGKAK